MRLTTLKRTLLIFPLYTFSVPVVAEIYKWVDEQGVTHYGENPQAARATETVTIEPRPAAATQESRSERVDTVTESIRQRRLSRERAAADQAKREQLAARLERLAKLRALGGTGMPAAILKRSARPSTARTARH